LKAAVFYKYFVPNGTFASAVAASKLWKQLRRFKNLFRPRAHPVILSQHSPAHRAGGVNQKLCRPRDVAAIFALTLVNQIVAGDRLEFGIGKKWKSVPGFLAEVARLFRAIDANRDGTNPGVVELIEILLNAPQLGVA